MSGTFFTLMILTMMMVLGVLVTGIFSMAKGGEFNRKYGNRLMQARIWLQGLALLFFALMLLALKK
jgi:Hypoxia induced protein conserved region